MANAEIYQIFYSDETRGQLDRGFIPLDNLSNERPDWREYWPMRRYLLNHSLQPDTYYGFFSSKFGAKTGLDSAAVHDLIATRGSGADVIGFSPYFDHKALYLNVIEQAINFHGLSDTFTQCASLIAPEFQVHRSVMTSVNAIFCNFLVAKPEFWREWLRHAERLFEIAEAGSTPLGQALSSPVPYVVGTFDGSDATAHPSVIRRSIDGVHAKVFVIERLASLLLWSDRRWRARSFSPESPRSSTARIPDYRVLDALKMAYTQTGDEPYLEIFRILRPRIAERQGQTLLQPATESAPTVTATPATAAPPSPPPDPPAAAGTAIEKIRIVCASRKSREEFPIHTALGQSLTLRVPPAVEVRLFPSNSRGLPQLYNTAIEESRADPAILLFVHDDVYLGDAFWADRLREALSRFDVVGIAGNRRRSARQPSWYFSAIDLAADVFTHDSLENLSGTICHGHGGVPERIDRFGPSAQDVKLLDGVFMAARSATLGNKSLRFDDRFEFHFYDMDFCRQAERAGLTLGTWPISITHGSTGSFAGDAWHRGYERYIEKWGE